MLNKKDFEEMRKEFDDFDNNRELLIKKTRDILKLSKQMIYSVHRDDLKEAEGIETEIVSAKKEADTIAKKSPKLEAVGAYAVAIGEFVEAMLYMSFLKHKKIPSAKELKVSVDNYLHGIIDLTGELGRKAVQLAGKGDFAEVVEIKEIVSEIYGELLKFDFRDSDQRRKFDSVKYDLKKMEDLVLELKLKGKI
jgi:predicted translin family RNA/ssDNA-binding protein